MMKMKRIHYHIIAIIAVILFASYFYLLKNGGETTTFDEDLTFPQLTTEVQDGERLVEMDTTMGTITLKLFENHAPKTVENFITHSENGYYEGVTFHRVMNDFMIQGGDPLGTGGGGESIYGDFFDDEFSKELYNIRGALSMANLGTRNTNTSQFFIVQRKSVDDTQVKDMEKLNYPEQIIEAYKTQGGTPWLDQVHTVFGQVVEGMEVVDRIAAVEVDGNGRPSEEILINKITVVK